MTLLADPPGARAPARVGVHGRALDRGASAPRGVRSIEAALATMPLGPGVYRMLDAEGRGALRRQGAQPEEARGAYTQPARLPERLRRMVMETVSMEIVTTHTEAEALLLEANLIKRLKPRFNIVLRDDKSYPWLMLAEDHAFPQIAKHRGAQTPQGQLLGAVRLRLGGEPDGDRDAAACSCCAPAPTRVFANRTRPCLLFQIKRCSAPCVGRIERGGVRAAGGAGEGVPVRQGGGRAAGTGGRDGAGGGRDWSSSARRRCATASAALTHVQGTGVINPASLEDADVIAAWQIAGQTCVQVFFVRGGRNNGNRAFFPTPRQGRGSRARCWPPSSPSSTTTSRRRRCCCSTTRWRSRR